MLLTGSSNKLQVELSADITFNNLPSGLKIEALVIVYPHSSMPHMHGHQLSG